MTKQTRANIAHEHLVAIDDDAIGGIKRTIQKHTMKYGLFAPSIVRFLYRNGVRDGARKGSDASLTTIAINAGAMQKFFCTERSLSALDGSHSIKNERISVG